MWAMLCLTCGYPEVQELRNDGGNSPSTYTEKLCSLQIGYAVGVDCKHIVRLIIMKLMWAWIVMLKKYWTLVHRLP